jgi:hypothetical protein
MDVNETYEMLCESKYISQTLDSIQYKVMLYHNLGCLSCAIKYALFITSPFSQENDSSDEVTYVDDEDFEMSETSDIEVCVYVCFVCGIC